MVRTVLIGALCFAAAALASTLRAQNDSDNMTAPLSYADIVLADQPAAYWTFDGDKPLVIHPKSSAAEQLGAGQGRGKVKPGVAGPPPARYPLFDKEHHAVEFAGDGGHIVYEDTGERSPLDFDRGDAITLEAWVNCKKLGNDQQVYIVGKGRTKNEGVANENQNYALRLRGEKGQASVSFLFRSADNRQGNKDDFHRWNSQAGFAVDSGWHHVAVTYTFGDAKSIRGYIDGQKVEGTWDYGGATDEAPVVDNDELWLGSSMGGNPGSTFHGQIDEVALYRTALSDERIAARFRMLAPKSYATDEKLIPASGFLVEIFEGVPDKTNWDFPFPEPSESYHEPALAFFEAPHKYNARGIREDRTNPFVLRVSGYLQFPVGVQPLGGPERPVKAGTPTEMQLLVRSRGASRLYLDDKLVAEVPFSMRKDDGHNEIYPINVRILPNVVPLGIGDRETLVTVPVADKRQKITFEIFCGGRGRRPDLGETFVASVFEKQPPQILNDSFCAPVVDHVFPEYIRTTRVRYAKRNQERRREASREHAKSWNERHRMIRKGLALDANHERTSIDALVDGQLKRAGVEPLPLVDDWSFLRRVSLDTIGTNPSPATIRAFFAMPVDQRRGQIINGLLDDQRGWADHWTSYWQDVLAENPNVINPTLNNTGPFRWWIHESLEDNKPIDRFATELILMEGSLRAGGPAGFGMASQNDAPMAAKAHVIAQAFLGMEMKCARCHDAPYHNFTQKQLFSLAAMLKGGTETLPKTSSIPGDENALKSLLVKVTLKPGEKVEPAWPFEKLVADESAEGKSRERLAELVTLPENHRFAQVIVNRVWARLVGRGIVESVDDWEHAKPSHPELLAYLERELILSGYDLKHIVRLTLNSHAYQRQITTSVDQVKLFAGVPRRRLTAEQVIDTLFAACEKPLNVEEMNIDADGGRKWEQSINLGPATRAWQFTSLSNERDRPALSLPAAQNVIDVLEAFGWRSTRPDPLTVRSVEANVLQMAILENGVIGKRITQFSDDSAFTASALKAKTVEVFVDEVFARLLTREPTTAERSTFAKLLTPGFETRIVKDAPLKYPSLPMTGVAWSNHLKPEASERKLKLKKQLEAGDPVTARLSPDWRERAEDVIWAVMNSPEFVVVP